MLATTTAVIGVVLLFALACAAALRSRAQSSVVDTARLVDRIDALLPQTQCTRCGYPACRPYAQAIARGAAPINRCPPGGEAGIRGLAALTGQPVTALDPECGAQTPPSLALIDEAVCIGCTKCIQACPVDAIVGAARLMHTIVSQLCTGCELCIPPCPVDCIAMIPAHPDARREVRPALPRAV